MHYRVWGSLIGSLMLRSIDRAQMVEVLENNGLELPLSLQRR